MHTHTHHTQCPYVQQQYNVSTYHQLNKAVASIQLWSSEPTNTAGEGRERKKHFSLIFFSLNSHICILPLGKVGNVNLEYFQDKEDNRTHTSEDSVLK